MTRVAYTPKEAAEATSLDLAVIVKAIETRELPGHVAREQLVVTLRDLDEWVNNLPVLGPKKEN